MVEEKQQPPTPPKETPTPRTKEKQPQPTLTKEKIVSRIKKSAKIPPELLFSPGGLFLLLLAVLIEVVDLIPIPLLDQIIEIPLEIVFIIFYIKIVKPPLTSLIIPIIIERVPVINDIIPTWLIRLFI